MVVANAVSLHDARRTALRTKPSGIRSGMKPRGRRVVLRDCASYFTQAHRTACTPRHGRAARTRRGRFGVSHGFDHRVTARRATRSLANETDRRPERGGATRKALRECASSSDRCDRRAGVAPFSVSFARKCCARRAATRRSQPPSKTPKQTRVVLVLRPCRAMPARRSAREEELAHARRTTLLPCRFPPLRTPVGFARKEARRVSFSDTAFAAVRDAKTNAVVLGLQPCRAMPARRSARRGQSFDVRGAVWCGSRARRRRR